MDPKEKLAAMADMETLSSRLGELANVISTLHLGLMKEKAEEQTLDCMICVFRSVRELHRMAEEMLSDIRQ